MTLGYIIALLFLSLGILSFAKIRSKKGKISFIYSWAFSMGSFVWEDLFIFSLYGFISTIVTIISNQTKVGVLLFLVFWVIRSGGEALYFFLEQFIEPKHHPHFLEDIHFVLLRKIFGPINKQQCYIILQTTFQIIMMFSAAALIYLLLNWQTLP